MQRLGSNRETTLYLAAVRILFPEFRDITDYYVPVPEERMVMTTEYTPPVPPMRRASELRQEQQDNYVPFWTSAEDPRNKQAEDVLIDQFLRRPATLSVRDVRDCAVPWSIEIVGKHSRNVQHVRLLCDMDAPGDILNLPYELERIANLEIYEQLGWGEHFGIDFLAFYSVQAQTVRLVDRAAYAKYLLDQQQHGIQFRPISRQIPRDPFKRTANGFLVPIDELENNAIIMETWQLTDDNA